MLVERLRRQVDGAKGTEAEAQPAATHTAGRGTGAEDRSEFRAAA